MLKSNIDTVATMSDGTVTIETKLTMTVTDLAKEKLMGFLEGKPLDSVGVRISVMPGGCSGAQYGMAFGENKEEHEVEVVSNGVRLFVDPAHVALLNGIKVDFVDEMMGGGFKIENPNATNTCGCGKSFS